MQIFITKATFRLLLSLVLWLGVIESGVASSTIPVQAELEQLIDTGRYTIMVEYPFVIVSDYDVNEAPEMTDSLFNAIAYGVRFKVNRTEIQENAEFLSTYHSLISFLQRDGYQVRQLYLRGAASPEGPFANNRRLGKGRASALMSLIQKDLAQSPLSPDSVQTEVKYITEDYAFLLALMEKRQDPDYARVKKIYDDCQGDELTCKRKLSRLDGGRVWNRLYKEYFPELRTARIVLWLSRPEPVIADTVAVQPVVETVVETEPDTVLTQPVITEELEYERRHLIALRTNLLHDFFYMPQFGMAFSPNLQLEYYPLDGHYTYNLGVTWGTNRKWSQQKFWQWRDVQFEVRRYFRGGGQFMGPYLGVYAQGIVYGIGFSKNKGWEGEGWGGGLDLGWVMKLNKKGNFRLEFNVSAGYVGSKYDPYVYGNPVTNQENGKYYYDYRGSAKSFNKRNHMFTWFGPTNLGINLTYDIIYRKKHLVQKGDKQ